MNSVAVIGKVVLAFFLQDSVSLEVGKPVEGIIRSDSTVIHTPTLDASYNVTPTRGNDIVVFVPESGIYTVDLRSFEFDAYIVLADSSGAILAEDDDSHLTTHARVVVELEAKKEYTLRACALHGKRGKFTVELLAGEPEKLSKQDQMLAEETEWKTRLAFIEETIGVETPEYATSLDGLGLFYFYRSEFTKAQAELESALAIREKVFGEMHLETGVSLNNLAFLFQAKGNYEKALPLYERALRISEIESGMDHLNTGIALNNFASLLQENGNYKEARPAFERVLIIFEKAFGTNHPNTALILNNIGGLLQSQGDFWEAITYHRRALAIRERVLGPDHLDTAASLSNLAYPLKELGDFEEARELYERGLAIREKTLGPAHPLTALSRNNLSILLQAQGDSEEAILFCKKSLRIHEESLGPEHPYTAMSLGNLGILLQSQGDYEEARPLFERSLAIRSKVFGLEHLQTANSQSSLAGLFLSQGDFEEANRLYLLTLETSEKVLGTNHPVFARGLFNLASLFYAQGKAEEALTLYRRSLAIREEILGSDHPDTSIGREFVAATLSLQGKYDEAYPYWLKSLAGSLSHLDLQLPSMSEAGRHQMLEISASPGALLDCTLEMQSPNLQEVYSLFQQWKGKATRLQLAGKRVGQSSKNLSVLKKSGHVQALAKRISELVLLPLADQAEDHVAQIRILREERIKFERELNRSLGLDSTLESPSLAEVQAGLGNESVLLDFFVGENVYVWVLVPHGEPRLISLGSRSSLLVSQDALLGRFAGRDKSGRGGRLLSPKAAKSKSKLVSQLWGPLRKIVDDAGTVFVSPDGFLSELPFGILQEADGTYLLEKHRFVYLSDPTRLAETIEGSANLEGALLAVGGVNYSLRDEAPSGLDSTVSTRSRIDGSWKYLKGTKKELESLSNLYRIDLGWDSPLTVVEGKAATEERIRAELSKHRYVHIATHGYFEPDGLPSLLGDIEEKQAKMKFGEQIRAVGLLPGLLSGLVFAGVSGEADPDREDGYLSAEEIQHLDLSACELVVLSACETALGSARAGEGLMSLRRAFSVAGADTVVSSLWQVPDEATVTLMKDFYSNLWELGMGRAEALHQAKLRMLKTNKAAYGEDEARPGAWGAFVLSGSWN